jgi:ABC transporter transmembrane region
MMDSNDASKTMVILTWIASTLQLLRLAIDLVWVASITSSSAAASKPTTSVKEAAKPSTTQSDEEQGLGESNGAKSVETSPLLGKGSGGTEDKRNYQSAPTSTFASISGPDSLGRATTHHFSTRWFAIASIWAILAIALTITIVIQEQAVRDLSATTSFATHYTHTAITFMILIELLLWIRDPECQRTQGQFLRIMTILAWSITMIISCRTMSIVAFFKNHDSEDMSQHAPVSPFAIIVFAASMTSMLVAIRGGMRAEQTQEADPLGNSDQPETKLKASANVSGFLTDSHTMRTLLKPYFWPDGTTDTAFWNRIRAILTWCCVVGAKISNLTSPLFLGGATTALSHHEYKSCAQHVVIYCILNWISTTCKEGQSVIYLKVAQAAFVQLSTTAFHHILNLSLDFHLRKKLGEVLRSMDRGISACDTLMKYLFLWLFPAIGECIVVCIIFAAYFQYVQ